MTPLARTAGSALAFTSLVLAFAAAAQAQAYAPPQTNGALAWVFAAFVAVAVVGIFLFVLFLVRGPSVEPPGAHPPDSARRRTV